MEIRGLIVSLRDLVDPGTICRICRVEFDDLELLAAVEDELRRCAPKSEGA